MDVSMLMLGYSFGLVRLNRLKPCLARGVAEEGFIYPLRIFGSSGTYSLVCNSSLNLGLKIGYSILV